MLVDFGKANFFFIDKARQQPDKSSLLALFHSVLSTRLSAILSNMPLHSRPLLL